MDLGLSGRKALVLSSSRGLGRAIATKLAAEGADVLLTGRNEAALSEAVAAINAQGSGRADHLVADLTHADFAATTAEAALARLGKVDILVNNTGGPPPGGAATIDAAVLATQAQAMVFRVIDLTTRLLPGMRAEKWGRVLTVASSGVVQPIPNLALSNTLRSALVGWSKTLASEVAADGVTCNLLLPGRIQTDRVDELDAAAAQKSGKDIDAVRSASRAAIPAGRYGSPDEFAAVAAFLCGVPASYVTGSVIRCDGGAIRSV
ncbi:SDR family oxidoreductase [Methylobrevis pamukkalensis]|uniref:3-oxoacyl-[acyl-carrier-protein] reductase FabG n=1 Tax=Methylobrevis pamukkalensis TaxID=1439726 RepID=A0A1E3H836_9HYPH|nr:SDR family oxidoreductase [Methylobrevis pamukkalensis]ODN72492.1 3-oxoacyl-[acyl-carrier-protein] reductase FabG [Methylobrevis pamukkalensis]